MPDDYDQINFRIQPERKKKWEEYVEASNEYRYVSNLIRDAVKQEINNSNQSSQATGPVPEGLEEQLDRMEDQLGEITERNVRMENSIGNIEREVTKDPELTELANEVFTTLPDNESAAKSYAEQSGSYNFRPGQVPKSGPSPSTIGELATVLDEREYRITEALERLQKDTYLVASVEINGEEYYYRDD